MTHFLWMALFVFMLGASIGDAVTALRNRKTVAFAFWFSLAVFYLTALVSEMMR